MACSPPRRKFDRDDIAGFLDLLPAKLDGIPLRHAIEPRHESFRDENFFALCRDHNVAVVFGGFDDEYPTASKPIPRTSPTPGCSG